MGRRYASTCVGCGVGVTRTTPAVNHFCAWPCRAAWRRRQPRPVTGEWLRQKYIDERLTMRQVAKIVGVDPTTIDDWLKAEGIPTRPRGGATSPGSFRKGQVGAHTGHRHSIETRRRLSAHCKATGRVPYRPEVGTHMRGKRGPQTPNWKGGVTPERQAFYSSPEWKVACVAVWARARGVCERCGTAQTNETRGKFHIHHVVAFADSVALRAEPSNLRFLCKPCHLFVHSNRNVAGEFIERRTIIAVAVQRAV